jgi:hypothetical protein
MPFEKRQWCTGSALLQRPNESFREGSISKSLNVLKATMKYLQFEIKSKVTIALPNTN